MGPSPKPNELSEEEALELTREILGVEKPTRLNLAGTKDDTALIPISALASEEIWSVLGGLPKIPSLEETTLILTQDIMTEGVHFKLSFVSPGTALTRCVSANLSDISAMGGVPLGAVVGLALPRRLATKSCVKELAVALRRFCNRYKFSVFGGDLVSAERFTISVAMLGLVEEGKALLRSGARVGDTVYLSKPLGLSALGLNLLKGAKKKGVSSLTEQDYALAVKAFLSPRPRIKLGRALSMQSIASSCIDLSDSLSKSVLLLAEESRVGFQLSFPKDALHPLVRRFYGKLTEKQFLDLVLSAEEDFELLFTAKAERLSDLPPALTRGILEIGKVVKASCGSVATFGKTKVPISLTGFRHFA